MNCKSMLAAALAVALAGHHLPVTSAERHTHAASPAAVTDARQLIRLPEPMRVHTITSMRDHLSALQEINAALSMNDFDKAAGIAERRLGMSSPESHRTCRNRCGTSVRRCTARRAASPSRPRMRASATMCARHSARCRRSWSSAWRATRRIDCIEGARHRGECVEGNAIFVEGVSCSRHARRWAKAPRRGPSAPRHTSRAG